MSKLYAINAYEQMYYGLHGIQSLVITEAENEDTVIDIAQDLSRQIIEDFVLDELIDNYNDIEEEEAISEDIAWDAWELKETNIPIDKLESDFIEDPASFIEKYAIKAI